MDTPTLVRELKALREGAGVFHAGGWGQFLITGSDAASFLHRMLSNEVQKLAAGEGRYQGLLDRKGMTLSLFYLMRLEDREFLGVTPPQLTGKTISLLTKMKFIEKVAIQDVSSERSLIQVIGPRAGEVLEEAVPKDLLRWCDGAFALPFFNISGPRDVIAALHETLASRIPSVSKEAVHLIRMSEAFPEYGVDLDESHILLESPVPVAHQRNKGCYPGQEVIERISTYGKGRTPKRLCKMSLKGNHPVPKGTPIHASDGTLAGAVTSAAYDPLEGKTIVLGYLENKFVDVGAMLVIALVSGEHEVRPYTITLSPPTPASPPTSS